jgi:hypothetical protein
MVNVFNTNVITLFNARTTDGDSAYVNFAFRAGRAMLIVAGTPNAAVIKLNIKDQYGNIVPYQAVPGTDLTFTDDVGTAIIELPYNTPVSANLSNDGASTSLTVTLVEIKEMR